ncbi:MAG TPA: hypothetical protein VLA56_04340 [Pseudomonadales bacterium]|nr:hypothetical protein [Pseudomonadales bacterium]
MSTASRSLAAGVLLLLLTGCWNGENVHVRLGDVSLGQQLMDLQRAHDTGAIDDDEYARLRAGVMSLAELCADDD